MSREILGICGLFVCLGCGSSQEADGSGGGNGAVGAGASGGSSGGGTGGVAGSGMGGGAGAGMSGAAGSATGGSGGTAGGASGAAGENASCPGSTNHVQGTRLRGRFVVTAEGDRAWKGWHDSVLDTPCSFRALADGTTRCVPLNWQISATFYSDAGCSAAVYTAGQADSCTPTKYIMTYRQGDCTTPSAHEFFELGATVTPAEVYALTEQGCTLVTPPAAPLYLRGAAVPPETFVAAEEFTAEGATRVRATGYLASDGTRQVTAWKDTALGGELCSLRMAEDGVRRCLPFGPSFGETYADAACSERVGVFTSSCDGQIGVYAVNSANVYCSADGDKVLERGEEFTGSVHASTVDGVCGPSTILEGRPLFRITPVPAADFDGVTTRIDESDPGRLKPSYHTSADGGCWFQSFWDEELGTSCFFDMAEDGVHRCLPGDIASFSDLYADAACSAPVRVLSLASCENPVDSAYVIDSVSSECDLAWRVYRTAPVTGALYRTQSGQCAPVEDTSGLRLVTPVDPTALVAGELRVE